MSFGGYSHTKALGMSWLYVTDQSCGLETHMAPPYLNTEATAGVQPTRGYSISRVAVALLWPRDHYLAAVCHTQL